MSNLRLDTPPPKHTDRTTRTAALWATVIAVPVTILVGLLIFWQIRPQIQTPRAAPTTLAAVPSTPVDMAAPKLSERAVLVVDNMLMSGEVALPEGASGGWRPESLAAARALNAELLASDRWLACVQPVGDGIAFATRS